MQSHTLNRRSILKFDSFALAGSATLVRTLLVPATMKLLGDANWWLPGWLDRLLPELDPALVEKPVEVERQESGAR